MISYPLYTRLIKLWKISVGMLVAFIVSQVLSTSVFFQSTPAINRLFIEDVTTKLPFVTESGKVKIRVHKNSVSGPLWDQTEPVMVYLEGPSQNGQKRFGELFAVYGARQASCTSRGGFAYQCPTSGTALWNGADDKSGSLIGYYSATIFVSPAGWQLMVNHASGNLKAGKNLVLDLAIKQ